ncbi:MAG: hypothetical protein H0W15_01115 [Gemmatimonadales bacterium]|nr:hypothetical protein [Gemmatimonadales bacterium]
MRTIVPLAILVLTACADVSPPTAPAIGAPSFSGGATHVAGSFFAVAACQADIGYNIRFGGPRVLVRHVAGTDTTLSFGTQELEGWRLPETTFDQTTVDFTVLGGAEIFNIKRDADGTLQVRIHQGTLVFRSLTGNFTVIARHVIRIVPGQDAPVNQWNCRLGGRP